MVSEDSTCTAAREVSSAAAVSCSRQQRESGGVRCAAKLKKFSCNGAETKERFCANQNTKESRRLQTTPTSKGNCLLMETPCMDLRAGSTRKVIRRTCPVCNPQSTRAPPRRDRWGQNTCVCIPHAYVCRSPLSRDQMQLALSKLEKTMLRLHSWGRRSDWLLGWAV